MLDNYTHIYLTLPGDDRKLGIGDRPEPLQAMLDYHRLGLFPTRETDAETYQAGPSHFRYQPAYAAWRRAHGWGYPVPEVRVYLLKGQEPLFDNETPDCGAIGIAGRDPILALVCIACHRAINNQGICCDRENWNLTPRQAVLAPARRYRAFADTPAGDPEWLQQRHHIQIQDHAPSETELAFTDWLTAQGLTTKIKVLDLNYIKPHRLNQIEAGV